MMTKFHSYVDCRKALQKRVTHQSGFSLVELMIAMTLGLLIIGAVITVFVSSQSSYRVKSEFDNTQDAFRFASHVLTRLIQSSESVIDPDSGDEVVRISLKGADGVFDCLGSEVPPGATRVNSFTVTDTGLLVCDPGIVGIGPTALVSGVESLSFLYSDVVDIVAPMRDDFLTVEAISNRPPPDGVEPDLWDPWLNVRSVRTRMELENGFFITFTATSRGQAIGTGVSLDL